MAAGSPRPDDSHNKLFQDSMHGHSPTSAIEDEDEVEQEDDDDDDDDDEDDPIVASYNLILRPEVVEGHKVMVLDLPTQDAKRMKNFQLEELRFKPNSGIVQVDVALNTSTPSFDQEKSTRWGTALKRSTDARSGGSLGLAGGFGVGAPPPTSYDKKAAELEAEQDRNPSFPEAVRQGKALTKMVYTGELSKDTKGLMVGVVNGNNIFLTPVSYAVPIRPDPTHIDAVADVERSARAAPTSGGAAAGRGAGGDKVAGRAIHMTVKSAMGTVTTETMADRLRAVQQESWQRMQWQPEESNASWVAYNEFFFTRTSGEQETADVKGKGKGKEVADPEQDDSGSPDLVNRIPNLRTDWDYEALRDAICSFRPESAPSKTPLTATNEDEGGGSGASAPAGRATGKRTAKGKGNAMVLD